MKRFINAHKKALAAVAAGAVVLSGGVGAYAYWTTTGSGTGTATTTAGQTGTLTFTTSTINPMYPGDSAQTFKVNVKNTDANQKEYVTTVKAYLTLDAASTGLGCTASDFKLDTHTDAADSAHAVTLGWNAQELAANGGNADTSNADTIQFNDKITNQDFCKSATVTLNYSAA